MKDINQYIIEKFKVNSKNIKKNKDIIYTYQNDDDINQILNDFDEKYDMYLTNDSNTLLGFSNIAFNISPYEYETTWKIIYDKADSIHTANTNIVKYIVASNIDNGDEIVAKALNKSNIGYDNWEVGNPENEKNIIKLICKRKGYELNVWED